jgi:general secretion pathway protein E
VLAQRLVRTLCKAVPQCRDDASTPDRRWMPPSSPGSLNGGYKPYKPVGCVDCRMTGFLGRMGLYELLTVSEAFKDNSE